VIIVVGVVIGNISRSHKTAAVSVTPFPSGASASAGHQEPPGKVGSSFELKDGSGNLYQVVLAKVIDPAKGENQFAAPDVGKRFVGLVFRVKALTGSPKDEDANNDAVVVGSSGQNYSADFDGIAGYTNFDHGVIHVSQGETVTGSVTFQVPNGVMVSTVQWTALSGFGSGVEWIVQRLAWHQRHAAQRPCRSRWGVPGNAAAARLLISAHPLRRGPCRPGRRAAHERGRGQRLVGDRAERHIA
jgi:hypothetical protein